jgi:hypothetical protein
VTREEAHVGQKVYFGRKNGEKTLGKVIRVNRKNLKVEQLESRGTYRDHAVGAKWTVHPSLCTPADEGKPAHVTQPRLRRKRPYLVNVLTGKRTYGRPGESHDNLFGRMANELL